MRLTEAAEDVSPIEFLRHRLRRTAFMAALLGIIHVGASVTVERTPDSASLDASAPNSVAPPSSVVSDRGRQDVFNQVGPREILPAGWHRVEGRWTKRVQPVVDN
ncbi:MAG: hypothetical protein AAF539_00625 [Planctomycetota bacterium]